MTPKEKAKDLVNKMKLATDEFGYININTERHKHCALIAVDEILFVLNEIDSTEQWNASWFYNQVKQEIEKL
jgi:hypothetical protein